MDDVDARTLVLFTTTDRASSKRGGYVTLRFRPTNAIKRAIVEMGNVVYKCSKANFEATCKDSKYNKGEVAEMLVTEKVFGETWHKDSVPFTDGADVNHYQVKFQGATFCSVSSNKSQCGGFVENLHKPSISVILVSWKSSRIRERHYNGLDSNVWNVEHFLCRRFHILQ